ncbi:MAG: PEP-CTERM sorting domain-containing protein [Burkholderiales bacterium]
MKLSLLAAASAALLIGTAPAHAALVGSPAALAGPTSVIDFEDFDGLLTMGPLPLTPAVTFTGDAGSEIGAFERDLGTNGLWGVGNRFAAGGFVGELRFTFAGVSSGAGAFVSHYADSVLPFSIVVSAYGLNNQIIESYTVPVTTSITGYNEGVFLGITRATADISSISFKGVVPVVDNLTFTTPVPEPGAYAMLLAGLALVGSIARRRR